MAARQKMAIHMACNIGPFTDGSQLALSSVACQKYRLLVPRPWVRVLSRNDKAIGYMNVTMVTFALLSRLLSCPASSISRSVSGHPQQRSLQSQEESKRLAQAAIRFGK